MNKLKTLNKEKVKKARELHKKGYSIKGLSRKFNCSYYTMYSAIRGYTWKDNDDYIHEANRKKFLIN